MVNEFAKVGQEQTRRAAAIFGGGRASRRSQRTDEPCKPTLRVG